MNISITKNSFLCTLLVCLALFVAGCSDSQLTEDDSTNAVVDTQPNSDFSQYDVICSAEQKQATICTADYRPVCADNGQTYSNGCSACSAQANAYDDGACGETGETQQILDHICSQSEKENQICTREYIPVCGSDGKTYATDCTACSAGIVGWNQGECTNE